MDQLKPFFGQIIGRNDIDFLNESNRKIIVQTHNTITNNNGGIIEGLEVTISTTDKRSLTVSRGSFYTSGSFSDVNNQGGGERGDLLTQQTFSGLPSTPPIGTSPQYLLVYAKITDSNSNPNPLKSNVVVTSKNLQTGENVPTQQYSKAIVVVTNPGFRSTLLSVEGVLLALIQVDYIGTEQVSNNNSIQFIDTSIATNYIIGGAIDVKNQKIVDDGVPDSFLTSRMYSDNSITGPKFSDNSITTPKFSNWDGITEYNDLTGSGIANQHLKDEAVTSNKINYKFGLDGFNSRNRVLNSSFETASGTSTDPENWNVAKDLGTNVSITSFSSDPTSPKFGNNSVFYLGAVDGGDNALGVELSQIIEFDGGTLKDVPISSFFWAKEIGATDFSKTNTTGLRGKIEFLDSSEVVRQTEIFGVVSGTNLSNYTQYSTESPVTYTGSITSNKIKLTIGGNFNGSYYVDGVWLGNTNLIPNFDINPSEYFSIDGIDANIITGEISTSQIADNAITTKKIKNADGSLSIDSGNGIISSHIRNGAIVSSKLANGAVTSEKLAAGTGLIPAGAIILWDNQSSPNCPEGFEEAIEFRGMFALGMQAAGVLGTIGINSNDIGGTFPATSASPGNTVTGEGTHGHTTGGNSGNAIQHGTVSPADVSPQGHIHTIASNQGAHVHNTNIPFRTVKFCRKTV